MAIDVKNYNVGIALLKFLMALVVVWFHFGVPFAGCNLAVPVFMLLSFFFVGSDYNLSKRILRVLYPFWFWSVIGIVLHIVLCGSVTIKGVLLQILLGHSYVRPLWFLPIMAICCVVVHFLMSGRSLRFKYAVSVLLVSVLLVLEHSGANFAAFCRFPDELKYPLGRIAEMLVYALVGCCLCDFSRGCERHKFAKLFCTGCICFASGIVVGWIVPECPGFGYAGGKLLLAAIGACLVFYSLGERITSRCNPVFLKWGNVLFATSACVYYCHYSVGCIVVKLNLCVSTWMRGVIVCTTSVLIAMALRQIGILRKVVN